MKTLKEYAQIVNARLETIFPVLAENSCIEGEMPELLARSMNYSLLAGGKRLRPSMVLAALDMQPDVQPDDVLLDALTASVNTQRLGNHPEALTTQALRTIYMQAFRRMGTEERMHLTSLWRHYAG